VRDLDEAVAWMRKYPFAEGEELEIRKVWEPADWEAAGAPEGALEEDARLRAKEAELRGQADR
jgi:hypothetical protein